jgi:5'-nucleotidase
MREVGSTAMRVLVTNDDGVESDGIVALARSLHRAGHDVFVVAPASDLSGAGASIGPLHRSEPIPVAEHHWDELPDVPVLALERPPATAVYLACLGAFGARPEVVASGINPGANTGHLILHSGTVGAALTAAGLGVPALAVSTKWSEEGAYEWNTAAELAVPALDWVVAGDERPRVLNLNVPNLPLAEVRGVREAELAPYGEFWVASSDIRSGDLRIEFQGPAIEPDGDTDAALVVDGYATVTPLLGIVAAPLKGASEMVENALQRGSSSHAR